MTVLAVGVGDVPLVGYFLVVALKVLVLVLGVGTQVDVIHQTLIILCPTKS